MQRELFVKKLQKILTLIAIAIAVIIVMGSILTLVKNKNSPTDNFRHSDPTPQKIINKSRRTSEKLTAYTDIGQIRATTKPESKDENGVLVIIEPWFSYPEGDTILFEEIAQKEKKERAIITDFFSRHTIKELRSIGEKAVKEELLSLINAELVLGKLRGIYFNEYIFFE